MPDFEISGYEGLGHDGLSPEKFVTIEGFDNYSDLSNEHIKILVEDLLPSGHLDYCEKISCDPQNSFWEDHPGAMAFHHVHDGVSEIVLDGKEAVELTGLSTLEILLHEIGHNALMNLEDRDLKEWLYQYQQALTTYSDTGFGFVSNYSHTDFAEDFAESYAAYVTNGDFLKFIAPDKYEFMRDIVFGGREYEQFLNSDGTISVVTQATANQILLALSTMALDAVNNTTEPIGMGITDNSVGEIYRCFNMVT